MSKRDYGITTSTLLANQAHKFERLLQERDDKLFALRADLWRVKRELRAALRALEETQEHAHQPSEKDAQWHEEN